MNYDHALVRKILEYDGKPVLATLQKNPGKEVLKGYLKRGSFSITCEGSVELILDESGESLKLGLNQLVDLSPLPKV